MKETKEPLNEGEIGEWKCWPKTQHSKKQKLWHLVLWAPKSLQMVTAAMKLRHLLLGRIATSNLESILKSRDNPLPTKFCIFKAMDFPVVMYECEHWTIKKVQMSKEFEYQRTNTFKLWCWRRLLRFPWTARRSNQSILKELNPDHSLKDWCWS